MDKSLNRTNGVRGIWRAILWGTLALLLIIPPLTMDWSSFDVMVWGVLLALLGVGVEAAMRLRGWNMRLAAGGAVLLVGLTIWAELAVGVFGTPLAGN